MNKISKTTEHVLTNYCYDQIQNHILNGTLAPGKKLKVRELAELLQTGHSPIREALARLTSSGLVQAQDNKGFYVAPISETDIHDIYHTFLQIELLTLAQAIKHGDDAWRTSIVASLYALSLVENNITTPSVDEWIKRNYDFHYALIAGCNSPALLHLRADIYRKFDRYCRISFYSMHKQLTMNHAEHKKLADAVLQKDMATTTTIMTHHILGSLSDVIQTLKQHKWL